MPTNPTPSRFPNGISNAAPWQFFNQMGMENPFFYHMFSDDFDTVPSTSVGWTPEGTGTAALAGTDGGQVTLTTAATASAFESIQRTTASFEPIAGKRLFFVARIQLSDVVNASFIAGLMPFSATPFTLPSNGIWISKAASSSQITLNVANAGTTTTTNFPLSSYTLTNGVAFDVGFYINQGFSPNTIAGSNVFGSIAPTLTAWVPQSGTGSTSSTARSPTINGTPALITTLQSTVLAPIIGVQTGNSTALSLTSDYVGAFRER